MARKEEVMTISEYQGGSYTDDGRSVSLANFSFENLRASFAIEFTSDQPRDIRYPNWGEFTRLEVGGTDWLNDETVNPRRARIFIELHASSNPRLIDVLLELKLPLEQRDQKTIFWWIMNYSSGFSESPVFWNPLLVAKLRRLGGEVPDPTGPRISTTLPISIEAFWVTLH